MRPSPRTLRATRPRRGAAIIYAVVVMSVLIGVCSLAVDYGRAQLVRSELQSTADGVARAAASGLSTSVTEAKRRARDLAAMNRADGAAITLTDADFAFGKWDADTNQIELGGTPIDAVEVTARRTVSLAFGSMIGKTTTDVSASATARAATGSSFTGFIGLDGVEFKNNAFIGSYRSSVTMTPTQASSTGNGIVSSNVAVEFWNNATVHGDVVLGPTGNLIKHKNLIVTRSISKTPTAFTPPADPAWNESASNPNNVPKAYSVSSNTSLPGGTYYFTSLTVNKRLTFTGPATVYVSGNIYTEDSIITYQNKPSNLKIYVLGTNRTIDLQKDISLYAEVQAPGAALISDSNQMFLYGKGIYRSIESKNNSEFYVDEDASGGPSGGGGGGTITLVQ